MQQLEVAQVWEEKNLVPSKKKIPVQTFTSFNYKKMFKITTLDTTLDNF